MWALKLELRMKLILSQCLSKLTKPLQIQNRCTDARIIQFRTQNYELFNLIFVYLRKPLSYFIGMYVGLPKNDIMEVFLMKGLATT